jgi:hypothetical protein
VRPKDRPLLLDGEFHCDSRTCKPNSVCPPWSGAGRPFLWAAHCCAALATYPEVERTEPVRRRRSAAPSLFGLAPCGVCPARTIAGAAVRSYRTFSPLPRRSCHPLHQHRVTGTAGRYVFCGTFRQRPFQPPHRGLKTRSGVPGKRRRPDVIRHTALWSSDFPPPNPRSLSQAQRSRGRSDRPARLSTNLIIVDVSGRS